MDPEEDLDIQIEPRRARQRRIVLGTTDMGPGYTHYDPSGERVEEGPEIEVPDEYTPTPVPAHEDEKGPASGPTDQQREWWEDRDTDRDIAQGSLLGDLGRSAVGMLPGARGVDPGIQQAQRRLGERAQRAGEEWLDAATIADRAPDQSAGQDLRGESMGRGALDAALLGWGDELGGAARSALRGSDYESERDALRASDTESQRQSPSLYAAGQAAGTLPWLAAPNPASAGGRIALGAAMGGADAAGHSEETGAALAGDAGLGALLGGGLGAAGESALAVARGPGEGAVRQRALEEMRDAADDALLAATGHAGHNRGAVEAFDFGDSRPAIRESRRRAADVLRETGAVPAAAGIRRTRRSIEDALRGATSTMDDVRTAMGSRGPTGSEVAERLRGESSRMDSPTAAQIRDVLDDFAERYGGIADEAGTVQPYPGARAPDAPIDYQRLVEDLGFLRDSGSWRTRAGRDVPLGEQGRRRVDRALRAAYDDALEAQASAAASEGGAFRGLDLSPEQRAALERLGEDPVQAYRDARRQFAVLDTALENAQRGEAAAAGNRGVGMSEMLWGNIGAGVGGGAGAFLGPAGAAGGASAGALLGGSAARSWRAIEPRVRARQADLALRLAQEWPELSERQIGAAQRMLGGLRVATGEGADEIVLDPREAPPLEPAPAAEPQAEEDPFADLDLEYEEE